MSDKKSTFNGFNFMTALLAVIISIIVGSLIFNLILGAPSNFDAEGRPIEGNYLGIMHDGGFMVAILISIIIIIITFTIERFISITSAKGKKDADIFLRDIKSSINIKQYDEAILKCDEQEGTLANIVKTGVEKLKTVKDDDSLNNEEKITAVQKELDETISLELPMLSKNLAIISTCASISTLCGLIGTVIGMIHSFAAMSSAGSPDTAALATGISEALINTALGVTGSVVGIVAYNYFSTRIDNVTHSMDEAGYSILHSLKA